MNDLISNAPHLQNPSKQKMNGIRSRSTNPIPALSQKRQCTFSRLWLVGEKTASDTASILPRHSYGCGSVYPPIGLALVWAVLAWVAESLPWQTP